MHATVEQYGHSVWPCVDVSVDMAVVTEYNYMDIHV